MVDFDVETPFKIKGKKAQPKVPLTSTTQMKRCSRKCHGYFRPYKSSWGCSDVVPKKEEKVV